MIELVVPALDKEYDFQLDENVSVKMLIEEIVEMICHREQSLLVGKENKLMLCHLKNNKILDNCTTLGNMGIQTGDRLMLV